MEASVDKAELIALWLYRFLEYIGINNRFWILPKALEPLNAHRNQNAPHAFPVKNTLLRYFPVCNRSDSNPQTNRRYLCR